jgi:adenylyltransferase/sulfurtransferase
MVQATEVLKLLAGLGDSLVGRLLHYDALEMRFAEFLLPKDPDCRACGEGRTITELTDAEAFCEGERGAMIPETTVQELDARRRRGEALLLIDVREPQEHEIARIDGALLLPLGALPERIAEIADWKAKPIVIHCHHGGRSARAVALLQEQGFTRVENLRGGIDAWSQAVDPSVPRY